MSESPFQVKAFSKKYNVEIGINQWLWDKAQTLTQEFDIRQILDIGEDILVFYEVTALDAIEDVCREFCRGCGSGANLSHYCAACDNRE